jgi:hypothetical protein
MKIDWLVKTLFVMIAVSLGTIAFRPILAPSEVRAQGSEGYPFYVEPGVAMLRAPDGSRQVFGKVVVDHRSGKFWGFPTSAQDPHPADPTNTVAPASQPFLLAKFAFGDTDK